MDDSEKFERFLNLPELIRNCNHSWIAGPEKACAICGKVDRLTHGCQSCFLLLCDACYGVYSTKVEGLREALSKRKCMKCGSIDWDSPYLHGFPNFINFKCKKCGAVNTSSLKSILRS